MGQLNPDLLKSLKILNKLSFIVNLYIFAVNNSKYENSTCYFKPFILCLKSVFNILYGNNRLCERTVVVE